MALKSRAQTSGGSITAFKLILQFDLGSLGFLERGSNFAALGAHRAWKSTIFRAILKTSYCRD